MPCVDPGGSQPFILNFCVGRDFVPILAIGAIMAALMKLPRMSAGLLMGIALAISGASAQAQSSAAVSVGGESTPVLTVDQVKQLYAQAKPYLNDPLHDLQHAVPDLRSLRAAGTEVNLQSILDRTGEVVAAQVPKIPDLIASESISEAGMVITSSSGDSGLRDPVPMIRTTGRGQVQTPAEQIADYTTDERQLKDRLHLSLTAGTPRKNFDYLVFYRPAPEGRSTLEESRTDAKARNNRQSQEEEQELHATGFAHLWLMFLQERIPQSNYRLLGEQKMYGHETYVVAFAQSPDRVTIPGQISAGGRTYPLLYQGIAWIDEATFRIVRLRTDLLAPLAEIQIPWLSSDLAFSEVRIPEQELPLWLPRQVELMWRQGDDLGGEMHSYAKYRLFHATAKMLPPS
jgi:hypothetical protein